MNSPKIASLGHVGIYVDAIAKMVTFYRDILGLTVTDGTPEGGAVFLSSRPAEEHHEFALIKGRRAPDDVNLINQLSFRCATLEDVTGYYRRFVENDVRFDRIVCHGNAVGIYYFDPEGNRCEVYCSTGYQAKQPFVYPIDLSQPIEQIKDEVARIVEEYGTTGVMKLD